MAYNPSNPVGQTTMANSDPVTLAANQTPVSASILSGSAPHNIGRAGGSGFTLVHKDVDYSTLQAGTAIWTPTSGRRFVVTDISVTSGGTTAGTVILFDSASTNFGSTATGANVNSNPNTVFRCEVAPSTTVKPGFVKAFNPPYVSLLANNSLRVSSSAAINPLYIQVNGYEL